VSTENSRVQKRRHELTRQEKKTARRGNDRRRVNRSQKSRNSMYSRVVLKRSRQCHRVEIVGTNRWVNDSYERRLSFYPNPTRSTECHFDSASPWSREAPIYNLRIADGPFRSTTKVVELINPPPFLLWERRAVRPLGVSLLPVASMVSSFDHRTRALCGRASSHRTAAVVNETPTIRWPFAWMSICREAKDSRRTRISADSMDWYSVRRLSRRGSQRVLLLTDQAGKRI